MNTNITHPVTDELNPIYLEVFERNKFNYIDDSSNRTYKVLTREFQNSVITVTLVKLNPDTIRCKITHNRFAEGILNRLRKNRKIDETFTVPLGESEISLHNRTFDEFNDDARSIINKALLYALNRSAIVL